jgi:hypothetical protein
MFRVRTGIWEMLFYMGADSWLGGRLRRISHHHNVVLGHEPQPLATSNLSDP